ncbi:MAG: IS66 family insertion sequence element accessory protein TnpB [Roseburia sp.]|uniref:IS66 family insertion sequence element accessory protein TnpB n=1 Tax=Roseburia sp. 831b TaxID=1261635 RepID=UPI00095332F8|nr:IS66 family insertion sequence element accessory protein TnpB [Roseburia sp. 831b]MCI5920344.1 IS66 family insertion sequence element accessory protein TnpB [Roseburia sp.]MDY5882722.1 IS66 family insertion sequence element accessory protein TnpB [Roseburia sp.]WVK73390.1 IS66 family insertion sequence element accessory protein TnpB [Roseburia sp. 831b]
MKQFDYTEKWKELLTPEIVGYLTTIHEYKGEQRLIAERHADVLESLVEVAKIQSTESSNKIEGIYTSDERLKKIVLDKTMPKTRNEREIAGYRDVLNTIHENFTHIPIRDTFILQIHRDLYKFEKGNFVWPRNESEVRALTSQQFRWLMEGLTIFPKKTVQEIRPPEHMA